MPCITGPVGVGTPDESARVKDVRLNVPRRSGEPFTLEFTYFTDLQVSSEISSRLYHECLTIDLYSMADSNVRRYPPMSTNQSATKL